MGLRPNPECPRHRGCPLDIRAGTVSNTTSVGGALTEVAFPFLPEAVTTSVHSDPWCKAFLGFERVKEQGARSGLSEAEITLSLSQLIELGGKRAKRIHLAEREQELAQWGLRKRANVIESVATAFVHVLASQERLKLQTELVTLAEQVHQTVSKQVQ